MSILLEVKLLGQFEVLAANEKPVPGFEHAKAQELFAYLLLNRGKPVSREIIASQLWPEHYTTSVSKKYLRKALWHLHTSLDTVPGLKEAGLLEIEQEWLRVNEIPEFWLDIAVLDRVYDQVRGMNGESLDESSRRAVWEIVDLYRGDLLNCQMQDWCFYEQLRYRQIYLTMLDKLVDGCTAADKLEYAISFANRILKVDPARERTHENLMRLYYLAGDRTAAVRQFRLCETAMSMELEMSPSRSVLGLLAAIQADEPLPERNPEHKRSVTHEGFKMNGVFLEVQDQLEKPPPTSGHPTDESGRNGTFRSAVSVG